MEWIFEGIGTEIIIAVISLVVGGLGGGAIGYRIGTKSKVKQNQIAGKNSTQNQIGSVIINGK